MSVTEKNTVNASPAESLARATRKPRGSVDGMWDAIATLRNRDGWAQRGIAQLSDVSDAMISYVFKQPDLKILTDKTESELVRMLFAPVRGEDGKVDVDNSLRKAANYNAKLTEVDARALAEDIQNGTFDAHRAAAAAPRASTPRSARSGFASTTGRAAQTAEDEAANAPVYVPNPLEEAMLKFAGALHGYQAEKAVLDLHTANSTTIPRTMFESIKDAADETNARHSELSKALAKQQVAMIREMGELRRFTIVDDAPAANEASFKPALSPVAAAPIASAHAATGFKQVAAPAAPATNEESFHPVSNDKLKLA